MRCKLALTVIVVLSLTIPTHAQSVFTTDYRAFESFKQHLPLNIPESQILDKTEKQKLQCLSWNLYFEARGGTYKEKVAITYVPINRMKNKDFSNNACDNIFQITRSNGKKIWQFSWAGKKLGKKFQIEEKSWVDSQRIAYDVMKGKVPDYGKGASYFYHTKAPNKRVPCRVKTALGSHVFCN